MIGIDTIAFKIPIKIPIDALGTNIQSNTYCNQNGSKFHIIRMRLKDEDNRSPFFVYNATNESLKATIPSLPYFSHSNSAIPIKPHQIESICDSITELTSKRLGCQMPDSRQWNVVRFDAYADFNVGDSISDYLSEIAKIQPTKHRRTVINHDTVCWQNSVRNMKFYNRYSNAISKSFSSDETTACHGILRFETSVSYKDLPTASLGNTVTFYELANPEKIDGILSNRLRKINLNGREFLPVESIIRKVENAYSLKLATQVRMMLLSQEHGHNSPFGRTKTHELNKIISSLGIAPVLAKTDLSGLALDSPLRVS